MSRVYILYNIMHTIVVCIILLVHQGLATRPPPFGEVYVPGVGHDTVRGFGILPLPCRVYAVPGAHVCR